MSFAYYDCFLGHDTCTIDASCRMQLQCVGVIGPCLTCCVTYGSSGHIYVSVAVYYNMLYHTVLCKICPTKPIYFILDV